VQFRKIENVLGLVPGQRLSYGGRRGYCSVLNESDAAQVLESEQGLSLFVLMEAWLERCPFLEFGENAEDAQGGPASTTGTAFSFWEHYKKAVVRMLDADESFIKGSTAFTPDSLQQNLKDLGNLREHFSSLLDPEKYAASLERGERRLSYRATQAALMIILFQREPGLQLPYRLISILMEIDERLCAWRARHAQMVHRMLGSKLGTGGSSGYSYLKATVDRHRVFVDLFNLSTFLIPEAMIPSLPASLQSKLSFVFSQGSKGDSQEATCRPPQVGGTGRSPFIGSPLQQDSARCPFGHS